MVLTSIKLLEPGYNDTALTGSDFVVATTPETVSVPLAEMSANGTATFQTKVQLVDNNNSITDFSAVTLSLSGLSATDTTSGTYTGNLTAGNHGYTLTYAGTVIASGNITVTASNDVADNTTEIALHNVTFDATDLADVIITVTGNTIAGAGLVATTAADGNVTVILADATGDYSYSAAKTDYATVSGTFSGTGTSVLFSLTKADASAVVTVTSVAYPGTGAAPALVGAQVSLYDVDPAANPGASALETVTSDGDGKATFTVDLTAGETYYLVATMAHHNDATGSFTATAGDNTAALQLVEFQKRAATFVGAQDGDVISIYSDAAHNNLITTLDGTANFTTGSNVTLYATETYYYTYTSGGATSASTFVMNEGPETPFRSTSIFRQLLSPCYSSERQRCFAQCNFRRYLIGRSYRSCRNRYQRLQPVLYPCLV